MKAHATPAEQDAAREEWFAGRLERQREKERKARRKMEQEAFLREWWGLPEKDREARRREMEKLQRPERIGGMTGPGSRGRINGGQEEERGGR
jgi:COX assembly protein 1